MSDEIPPLKFFLDHNVANSVAVYLRGQGYEVILLRMILATNSPDQLVAAVSQLYSAILVTHDGDFKQLASRLSVSNRRFRKLSQIFLGCSEPRAASRMQDAMSLIVHEWESAQKRTDKRVIIKLNETVITTTR